MPRGKVRKRVVLPEATELGRLYSTDEVAQILNVTPRTVQHWIRIGKLPAMRYGRLYRVPAKDLQEFGERVGQ
jgi:excisionase family DNA binding protein